ncbi:hypothetical protein KXS07_36570 [Inquilinus limosus]|uniref:hypothetical protein n=1 Tax=Inquilinus limosus TaxID=171674 RepID=UPI003F13ECA1
MLVTIDANINASDNDAFTFIATDPFTKDVAGQLRYEHRDGDTVVQGRYQR